MERMTVKSIVNQGHYSLKRACIFDKDGEIDEEIPRNEICDSGECDCDACIIQMALDHFAAYEDIGLSPEEIIEKLGMSQVTVTDEKKEKFHACWIVNPSRYYPQCSHCYHEPDSEIGPNGELPEVCSYCGAIMDATICGSDWTGRSLNTTKQ